MVAISPCMNAHGTVELASGHFSPLGQYTCNIERSSGWGSHRDSTCSCYRHTSNALTSVPCCLLMESRLQGKQNLWCGCDGHCTKWVSSSLSWHSVHLSSGAGGAGGAGPAGQLGGGSGISPVSDDDTDVVDDTCREPEGRRAPGPPGEPAERSDAGE